MTMSSPVTRRFAVTRAVAAAVSAGLPVSLAEARGAPAPLPEPILEAVPRDVEVIAFWPDEWGPDYSAVDWLLDRISDEGSGWHARAWCEFERALRKVTAVVPERLNMRFNNPLCLFQESAVGLWCDGWGDALRIGVALGRALERGQPFAVALPTQNYCLRCHGAGTPQRDDAGEVCPECHGRGIVDQPARAIRFPRDVA